MINKKIQYLLDNYQFEELTSNHDLSNFICESDDLNDFIKNDALKQQKEHLNVTQLVVCDDEIIGFVSLLNDNFKLKDVNEETRNVIKKKLHNIKEVPSVKIGRFAIAENYGRKGIGSDIIGQIILEIKDMSKKVGIRFIIVDAYAVAYYFYKRNNFIQLEKDDKHLKKLDIIIKRDPTKTFTLYQDISKLE